MTYVPVQPLKHAADCRKGCYPPGSSRQPQREDVSDYRHFGLDRERCERCRNLWAKLKEAHARREAGAPASAAIMSALHPATVPAPRSLGGDT